MGKSSFLSFHLNSSIIYHLSSLIYPVCPVIPSINHVSAYGALPPEKKVFPGNMTILPQRGIRAHSQIPFPCKQSLPPHVAIRRFSLPQKMKSAVFGINEFIMICSGKVLLYWAGRLREWILPSIIQTGSIFQYLIIVWKTCIWTRSSIRKANTIGAFYSIFIRYSAQATYWHDVWHNIGFGITMLVREK